MFKKLRGTARDLFATTAWTKEWTDLRDDWLTTFPVPGRSNVPDVPFWVRFPVLPFMLSLTDLIILR